MKGPQLNAYFQTQLSQCQEFLQQISKKYGPARIIDMCSKGDSNQDKVINQILHLRDQGTVYIEEEENKQSEIAANTIDGEPSGLSQDSIDYLDKINQLEEKKGIEKVDDLQTAKTGLFHTAHAEV